MLRPKSEQKSSDFGIPLYFLFNQDLHFLTKSFQDIDHIFVICVMKEEVKAIFRKSAKLHNILRIYFWFFTATRFKFSEYYTSTNVWSALFMTCYYLNIFKKSFKLGILKVINWNIFNLISIDSFQVCSCQVRFYLKIVFFRFWVSLMQFDD